MKLPSGLLKPDGYEKEKYYVKGFTECHSAFPFPFYHNGCSNFPKDTQLTRSSFSQTFQVDETIENIKALLNDRWNAFEQARKIADDPEFWKQEFKPGDDEENVCNQNLFSVRPDHTLTLSHFYSSNQNTTRL